MFPKQNTTTCVSFCPLISWCFFLFTQANVWSRHGCCSTLAAPSGLPARGECVWVCVRVCLCVCVYVWECVCVCVYGVFVFSSMCGGFLGHCKYTLFG